MNKLVIEKEDLRHNIEQIKKFANQTGKDDNGNPLKIIAVVKANGYGLGLVEYTKFLIDNGIQNFAVAGLQEAITLRKAGIREPILMLSSTAIEKDIRTLIENKITITVGSKQDCEIVEKIGKELGKKIKVHLKIDTGFGRYGFIYNNRDQIIEAIKPLKYMEIEGTFTHFSVSFFNEKYTKLQFERFIEVIEVLKMNDINPGILHVCNSSAFVKYPQMHLNAVRVGSAFLGRLSFQNNMGLKKIGQVESKVTEIKKLPKDFYIGYSKIYKTKKETKVAIVPCGYMDGFNLENGKDMFRTIDKIRYLVGDIKSFLKKQGFSVKINGQNCKVLGRIGTYHITCDITGKDIKIGDKVILEVNPKFVDSSIRRVYK